LERSEEVLLALVEEHIPGLELQMKMRRIILQMLTINPEKRPNSAEVKTQLQHFKSFPSLQNYTLLPEDNAADEETGEIFVKDYQSNFKPPKGSLPLMHQASPIPSPSTLLPREPKPIVIIPKEILALTEEQNLVYQILNESVQPVTRVLDIMKQTGKDKQTVKRILYSLKQKGLVEQVTNSSNWYKVK
jgi:hypothetical protein